MQLLSCQIFQVKKIVNPKNVATIGATVPDEVPSVETIVQILYYLPSKKFFL